MMVRDFSQACKMLLRDNNYSNLMTFSNYTIDNEMKIPKSGANQRPGIPAGGSVCHRQSNIARCLIAFTRVKVGGFVPVTGFSYVN